MLDAFAALTLLGHSTGRRLPRLQQVPYDSRARGVSCMCPRECLTGSPGCLYIGLLSLSLSHSLLSLSYVPLLCAHAVLVYFVHVSKNNTSIG